MSNIRFLTVEELERLREDELISEPVATHYQIGGQTRAIFDWIPGFNPRERYNRGIVREAKRHDCNLVYLRPRIDEAIEGDLFPYEVEFYRLSEWVQEFFW